MRLKYKLSYVSFCIPTLNKNCIPVTQWQLAIARINILFVNVYFDNCDTNCW